jgi:RNA polymerase sigma-70 factor, ECF subfamily
VPALGTVRRCVPIEPLPGRRVAAGARADLLRRRGRDAEAVDAYRRALALEPPAGERAFIARRIEQLS